MSRLHTQARALKEWAIDAALPFWAGIPIDENGGYFEHLAMDGTANTDVIRRVRVQARQVYSYAQAHHLGWFDGCNIAEQTFDFMCDTGLSPDDAPGFVHLINPDYSVNNAKRDFYDHAFYLLSCAWLYRVTRAPKALSVANDIRKLITGQMASPHGGWIESLPPPAPPLPARRQNPHMHFLEASMALYDTLGDAKYLHDAKAVFALFEAHFFDREHHFIREFFNDDWTIISGELGHTREPGHAAEWVWLLLEYQRRTGIDTSEYANVIYATLDTPNLFLNDEEHYDRTPRRATKRLWCQTELIKAHLAQTERGHTGSADKAADIIAEFRNIYLRDNGTWMDQIDANGAPCATTIPTSTFYHIMCMIEVADRVSRL